MWTLTCADSPAHRWAARRRGPRVFNRDLNESHRTLSSSCGVVVVVGARSSGVVVIVVVAAAAVMMELVVLLYRDGWWG